LFTAVGKNVILATVSLLTFIEKVRKFPRVRNW